VELSVEQQILEYWNKAEKVLIALPENPTVDKVCAALALRQVIKKMQKQADIVCPTSPIPGSWDFLTEPLEIKPKPADQDVLVISLSTAAAKLDELSYQSEESAVKIFLKPKGGMFSPNDIEVSVGGSAYDLVVTLGVQNLEALAEVYQSSPQLFFSAPKINLDINPANEYFGTINLIEVTASSVSELMTRLVDNLEPGIMDENIATVLMAGIIAQTHSFQDASTTPKTLSIAARLVTQGARQQDIIQTLYKTKDFSLLKLWGRALARIKTAQDGTFLYSFLTESDFTKTNLPFESLPAVLAELIDNIAGFQTVALLGETGGNVTVLLAGLPHTDIGKVARTLNPQFSSLALPSGSHLYQCVQVVLETTTLEDAERRLLSAVV
jgi:nanoRNase/pAp phosphatase (c-di-AMP/oligoRNAs hydrolase)